MKAMTKLEWSGKKWGAIAYERSKYRRELMASVHIYYTDALYSSVWGNDAPTLDISP